MNLAVLLSIYSNPGFTNCGVGYGVLPEKENVSLSATKIQRNLFSILVEKVEQLWNEKNA